MSQHTPGPWTVKTPQADPNAFDVYAGQLLITRGYWACNGKANARLIAAAPDLLEALRECADRLHIHMVHTEDLMADMKAQKAIAKAEGR